MGKGKKLGVSRFRKDEQPCLTLFGHGQLVKAVADLVCQTASGQILTGKRTQRAIAQECRVSIVCCDLIVPGDPWVVVDDKSVAAKARQTLSASPPSTVMPGRAWGSSRKSERPRAASAPVRNPACLSGDSGCACKQWQKDREPARILWVVVPCSKTG